jgi:hypothetical protein
MGHDDYVLLGGFCGNVDPALVLMAGDLNGDAARGRVAGYAAEARRDQVVDVAGDNEQSGRRVTRRVARCPEAAGLRLAPIRLARRRWPLGTRR